MAMSVLVSSSRSVNSVAEGIEGALAGSGEPWLPGLAGLLVDAFPLSPAFEGGRAYGTARWVLSDPTGPRDVAGEVAIARHCALVEILPEELAGRFGHLAPARTVGLAAMDTVSAAVALLGDVPSLAESTGSVVRALHVIHAEAGYDTSHSEPTIPFSVFVSVPTPGENDAVIRVAESIVHEAMHLQLTLVEGVLPLVAIDGEGFSPWQGRVRPVGGLLHGLYVFSVILRFMDLVADLRPELSRKARQRRTEIVEEVASLGDFSGHLTKHGKLLRSRCLAAVGG